MNLTSYLVMAVFGLCVPCHSMPTSDTVATGFAEPQPRMQSGAVEPAENSNGKRSRSLFQTAVPTMQQYQFNGIGGVDLMDVVMDELYAQQQQRQQGQEVPTGEEADEMMRTEDTGTNYVDQDDPRAMSRAQPGSGNRKKPDSPMYFIRLPPQPYMFVPGYGYVSQPTRLEPPPFMQRPNSPFLNLPLGYVSNAKPVGVYTLPQQQYQQPQQQRPHKPHRRPQPAPATTTVAPPPPPMQQQHQRPDSPLYNMDKGPYVFNGRPSDVFLYQSAYDNLYSEVLQNIYP